jgi:NAD(P)-dependent dehydrogenase (short-subunit alcohol dehydrogenase family)
MHDLRGKACVITGGAGGIGLAMARRFQRAGMGIVLGDVEKPALDSAVAELGDGTLGVVCDVTSPSSMDELRDAAVDRFGAVHVVCLNAGVAPISPLLDTSPETWRWVIDVNVMGVAHGVCSFGPPLAAQGEGHVVLTASAAGLTSTLALGAYSASKHAVVGLAATLREELHPAGVGVSVLCPGVLKTRIFESERNRPDDVPDDADRAPAQVQTLYRAAVDAAGDPALAADAVHDAVVDDRLFVLPSPEMNGMITQRLDAIRDALPATP